MKDIDELMRVLDAVIFERGRQEGGGYTAAQDDEHLPADWLRIIRRELDAAEDDIRNLGDHADDRARLRGRLVRAAAVAVAGVESIDRKAGKAP